MHFVCGQHQANCKRPNRRQLGLCTWHGEPEHKKHVHTNQAKFFLCTEQKISPDHLRIKHCFIYRVADDPLFQIIKEAKAYFMIIYEQYQNRDSPGWHILNVIYSSNADPRYGYCLNWTQVVMQALVD